MKRFLISLSFCLVTIYSFCQSKTLQSDSIISGNVRYSVGTTVKYTDTGTTVITENDSTCLLKWVISHKNLGTTGKSEFYLEDGGDRYIDNKNITVYTSKDLDGNINYALFDGTQPWAMIVRYKGEYMVKVFHEE